MNPIVTLTTDFGTKDSYVAAMKGVILRINPNINIIDLTHDISPQNILEANLFLYNSCPYFPQGTIHLVIIDPGVGTDRDPIVVSAGNQIFVCPNNGVLTMLSRKLQIREMRIIQNKDFMLKDISSTFHGRDIFAPTAGYLASGKKLDAVGEKLEDIVIIKIPEPIIKNKEIIGEIIHIDKFGNLISNINSDLLVKLENYKISICNIKLDKIYDTYGEKNINETLTLIGSSGFLEISINQGNAFRELGIEIGEKIIIKT